MLIEKIKIDFEHKDERGRLIQLCRRGYSQFNIIESKKGVKRGDHYHKYNTEAFYIINGSCRVVASKDGVVEEYVFNSGDYFRVAPFVKHSFEYMDDTILASMYSLGVELDNENKDIFE